MVYIDVYILLFSKVFIRRGQKATLLSIIPFSKQIFYKIRARQIDEQVQMWPDANRHILLIQEKCALTINDELFSKEIRTMVTPCKSLDKSECIRELWRAECGTARGIKKERFEGKRAAQSGIPFGCYIPSRNPPAVSRRDTQCCDK